MKRRLIAFVAALVISGIPLAGVAVAEAADNAVVVINTQDFTQAAKSRFKVERVPGDTVDQKNAAWAESSCENCRTIAVATQVLLAGDHPSNVSPQNLAAAVNDQCTSCETMAVAFQFVMETDGPVYFTTAGSDEITAIKHDMRDAAHSDASLDDIKARLDADASQLWQVLQTELVESGRQGDVREYQDHQQSG